MSHPLLREVEHLVDPGHRALIRKATNILEHALCSRTKRVYAAAERIFTSWCLQENLTPLPATPSTVALFVAHLRSLGRKSWTIAGYITIISSLHKRANLPNPTRDPMIKELMRSVRRTARRAELLCPSLTLSDLRLVITSIEDSLIGARDRALLLLAYSRALRSEIYLALDVEQLFISARRLVIHSRNPDDPPIQIGRADDPVLCPVRAMSYWLEASDLRSGPLFRGVIYGKLRKRFTLAALSIMIKRRCRRAGLANYNLYASTSLRAGSIEEGALHGMQPASLMILGGFQHFNSLRPYFVRAERRRNLLTGRTALT